MSFAEHKYCSKVAFFSCTKHHTIILPFVAPRPNASEGKPSIKLAFHQPHGGTNQVLRKKQHTSLIWGTRRGLQLTIAAVPPAQPSPGCTAFPRCRMAACPTDGNGLRTPAKNAAAYRPYTLTPPTGPNPFGIPPLLQKFLPAL